MLALARARGARVSFVTNGSYFTPQNITRILEGGVEKISVSNESPDVEAFRRIRGGKLEKVMRGIADLLAARNERGLERPVVGFAITVMRQTRNDIVGIAALYRKLDMDGGAGVQPLQQMDAYSKNYGPELQTETLTTEELQAWYGDPATAAAIGEMLLNQKFVSGFYGDLFAEGSHAGCPWLDRGLFVTRDGAAAACCMMKDERFSFGNIRDGVESILAKRDELRRELGAGTIPEGCRGCGVATRAIREQEEERRTAASVAV